jgi:uncharacterized protein
MHSSESSSKGSAAGSIANWLFSVTTACISQITVARDQARGRIRIGAGTERAGTSIERVSIATGGNALDAVLVRPASPPSRAAVLICHGIGEIVEHWTTAQQLLAASGVTSLVFDYRGYGRSRGWASPGQCARNAVSAFEYLQGRMPSVPISVLGFSMGSGIAAAILHQVPVYRLVLCAAFTSFKAAAFSAGVPIWLSGLVPDIWHTQQNLLGCSVPALLIHGENDRLIPMQMALDLAASSCTPSAELVVVANVGHNDPFYHPQSRYWGLIAEFLLADRGPERPSAVNARN